MKKTQPKKPAKIDMKKAWQGMPEFVQDDVGAVKKLQVNFKTMDDVHKFAKLTNQLITAKTRSVWYPAVPAEAMLNRRYADVKPNKK